MIEEGLVKLIQGNSAVAALTPAGGGFFVALPKGQTLPSWSYQSISDTADYCLDGTRGVAMRRVQIDVFGSDESRGADCLALAAAINDACDGVVGLTMADTPPTYLSACIRSDVQDFFDDAGRTFRRMI